MRWITTVAIAAALLSTLAEAARAQTVQIGQDIGGDLNGVLTGEVITGDFISFPEVVVAEQFLLQEQIYEDFLADRFSSTPPIVRPDLPSPYGTSLRNLPGYYRVTLTQPTLD